MTIGRASVIALGLVAGTAAVGAWAWLRLPDNALIALQFDAHGAPSGFASKTVGLSILPAVGVCVIGLLAALPAITPRRKGLGATADAYATLPVGLAAIFLVSEGALVAHAMDPAFSILRWVAVAVGVQLAAIGNLLGKVRHNFVFGVRTPWTLLNERVWDKTHRFTGRLMVLSGLGLSVGAALLPRGGPLVALIVLCAAGPAIVGAAYSWKLYRSVERP